jgi:hypothetical protein
MPGRSFSTPGYSYGFNGQEKDDEVKGSGNSMTAEFWEYDSRLARRWNGDQIYKPWEAPYSCFNDNPIYYADPVGLDGEGPNGECPGDVDSKGQVYGGTLNEVTVTALKSNTISAYHLSNSIDAKRAQNVEKYKQDIQRTYANLDWEHGQVEPPISNFANTLFYSNRRVWMPDEHGNGWGINAQGYLTGKYVRQPIGGAGALEYLGGEGELKTLTSMSEGRALLKEGEYFLYMAEKKGLPYIGSTEKLLGRYTQGEIEELNARMFKFFVDNPAIRMPNRGIAIGFEQMVIKLNNAGEVINSTNKGVLLANLKNAASKEIYLIEAEKWAAKNIPNWQTLFKIKQ